MKRLILLLIIFALFLFGCSSAAAPAQIAATTLPVYEFTARLCDGTDLSVTRLITESVSCLHDYTLQVSQVRAMEAADVLMISGAGLEDFLGDATHDVRRVVDASYGIHLHCPEEADSHHDHDGHHHENDPHIWLSPANAMIMVENICRELSELYPQHRHIFEQNRDSLLSDLHILQNYGQEQLSTLSCRELITFHDGFGYMAEAFGLEILEAVEEESGSEAPASELIRLITLVRNHNLPAVFVEANGSDAAARIIAEETGIQIFVLDMAMAGDSYFDAMYRNIDTLKEALE